MGSMVEIESTQNNLVKSIQNEEKTQVNSFFGRRWPVKDRTESSGDFTSGGNSAPLGSE